MSDSPSVDGGRRAMMSPSDGALVSESVPSPTASPVERSPTLARPNRVPRVCVAGIAAIVAALFVLRFESQVQPIPSDFDPNWQAARIFWAGGNPYAATGPGLANDWPWPLFYPATTLVLLGPLTLLSLASARVAFAALSAGALAWAVTREGWQRLPLFASFAFYHATIRGQWSPLLTAAFLWPTLAAVLSAKPTLGAAVWLARPTRRAFAAGAALVVWATLMRPTWLAEWSGSLIQGHHFGSAIVSWWGGALILAALLRWRRPEARLLVLMALVPVTLLPYETLPLFVVPATLVESAILAALSFVSVAALGAARPNPPTDPVAYLNYYLSATGPLFVRLLYFPCVVMLLRRANEGPAPEWIERALVRLRAPAWLAGRRAPHS